jgi:pimeloyl-ACP methyl ester carboxylesterase
LDNDDILRTIRKPVLIRHGADDAIEKPSIIDEHTIAVPHAQVFLMPHAGHAPFVDDVPSFN